MNTQTVKYRRQKVSARGIFFLLLGVCATTGFATAQVNTEHDETTTIPDLKKVEPLFRERVKHEDLETELEIYPFNMVVPDDPVIKNEAMFDYHTFFRQERLLGGIRFFADANTHWAKARDMKDLILYTEMYYGFRNFQMGIETGSVTAEEYISVGPQFTNYDNRIFKRVSLITRVWPDYVLGYEFTTQELHVLPKVKVSSTGMGRLVLPSDQTVIQVSVWASFEKLKGIYIGVEYEHNNASFFNTQRYETNNELFLGVKAELH